MQYGRREIFTDVNEITTENVIKVLQDAMVTHRINADRCDFLIRYEAGEQPLQREKKYRADIDIVCKDNIAAEIVEFKLSYNFGNQITLIQRGEKDNGKDNEKENEAIALLNECYQAEGNAKKTQELARFLEICGIGYTYVDINTDWEEGESFFTVDSLDPRNTFVVKSSKVGHKPMLGVTYRQDALGNYYFTAFSKNRRYEIVNMVKVLNGSEIKDVDKWNQADRSGEVNPLGVIPIIEWVRAADRMGCFERVISQCDTINIMQSDVANQIDQNTQCIWLTVDVDFPTDEDGNLIRPKSNDWLQTYTSKDGNRKPSVNPLTVNYDFNGMLENIAQRRAWVLEQCNIPARNDDSGGSTGVAMNTATGWSSAEASACKEQQFIESAKMEEIRVVLKAINKSKNVPSDSPLLSLKAMDIIPSIKRQKSYELVNKVNALATGISHGIDYKSMIKAVNLFDDPNQVIEDSKEPMKKYLDSIFKVEEKKPEENQNQQTDEERLDQDTSDQMVILHYWME